MEVLFVDASAGQHQEPNATVRRRPIVLFSSWSSSAVFLFGCPELTLLNSGGRSDRRKEGSSFDLGNDRGDVYDGLRRRLGRALVEHRRHPRSFFYFGHAHVRLG
jgi:hypothetical protein